MLKLITCPPYDQGAENSYFIELTYPIWFGLFTKKVLIGNYDFDNGGAIVQMPFFNKKEAKQRMKILNKC